MKTIAQIAEEIGVSRQAVHQKIKKEPLSTDLQQFMSINGQLTMVDVDGENLIKASFSKEKRPVRTAVDEAKEAKDQLIEALRLQVEDLQRQNAEQSRQIDRLTSLAEQLTDVNKNNQVLLREQSLKSLPQIPEKTSFWSRFKRKKDD